MHRTAFVSLGLSLSVALVAVSVAACGQDVPAATAGVSAEPTAAPATPGAGSPEGGECGDDVAIQKKCATGLVCAPNPKAPVSEHTPGMCKKP
jgi:hypothetical protein